MVLITPRSWVQSPCEGWTLWSLRAPSNSEYSILSDGQMSKRWRRRLWWRRRLFKILSAWSSVVRVPGCTWNHKAEQIEKIGLLKEKWLVFMKKGWVCSLGKKLVGSLVLCFLIMFSDVIDSPCMHAYQWKLQILPSLRHRDVDNSPLSLSWSKLFLSVENCSNLF